MKKLFVLIVLILILGAAWWAFRKSLPRWLGGTETSSANTNVTIPGTAEQELQQRARQAVEIQQLKRARDSRRMNDLFTLQALLESYKNDYRDEYPQTLAELAPTYIGTVPADPGTGAPYQYTRTAGIVSYSILYTLEFGVNNLVAGQHTAIPGNVAAQ